jgi:hypothetical protein
LVMVCEAARLTLITSITCRTSILQRGRGLDILGLSERGLLAIAR